MRASSSDNSSSSAVRAPSAMAPEKSPVAACRRPITCSSSTERPLRAESHAACSQTLREYSDPSTRATSLPLMFPSSGAMRSVSGQAVERARLVVLRQPVDDGRAGLVQAEDLHLGPLPPKF